MPASATITIAGSKLAPGDRWNSRTTAIDRDQIGYFSRGKILAFACRSRASPGSLGLGGPGLGRAFGRAGHYLTAIRSRWFRGFAAALYDERDHLKCSIVLEAFMPWPRRKNSERVFAFA